MKIGQWTGAMTFLDPAMSKTEGLLRLVITQFLIVVLKEVFLQALVPQLSESPCAR